MTAEKIFKKVFLYLPDHFDEREVEFSGCFDELCVNYHHDQQCLLVTSDGEVLNENDEFLCYISDFEYFPNFVEYNKCSECNDNGYTRSEVYGSDCIECEEIEPCECDKPFKY